jgi:branched-chain amino acid transport system substrate-binding protein
MLLRRPLLIVAVVAVALMGAACSSTPGGSTRSSGSSSSADAVAKALGIDLSKCALDPTQRLSGTVKLGQTYPMSGGPAAAFAPLGHGVKASVENFSATSGLPVKFDLIQADDQFAPDKALTATQKLIQQDKVSAMTTTIGTPSVVAIRPLLEQNCIPLIAGAATGASANQPSKYPWAVAFTLPSAVDTKVWATHIASKFPNGAKVAMFYSDNASGQDYYKSFKQYLGQTKSKIVSTQTIQDTDSAAPASQVTTMKASGANVLVAAPTGAQCATLMQTTAAAGWKPTFYMTWACSSSLFDLAGSAANGVYVNKIVKDPTRAPYNNDPAVKSAVAILKQYAPGATITDQSLIGMMFTEPLFDAIKSAEKSPLGLSRLGLLQAATHMSFQPDLLIPGVKYQLNYPTDEVAMEAAQLTQYKAADKTFTYDKLYNFEGQMTGLASLK